MIWLSSEYLFYVFCTMSDPKSQTIKYSKILPTKKKSCHLSTIKLEIILEYKKCLQIYYFVTLYLGHTNSELKSVWQNIA